VSVPRLGDRTSGILLHPTSLPGPHGSGDLGSEARAFCDFLATAEQRWWQMLPVGPPGYGNSPYSAQSAFAGNPLLIALAPLVERGLLDQAVLEDAPRFPGHRADFVATERFRMHCLRAAYAKAVAGPVHRAALDRFRDENRAWLAEAWEWPDSLHPAIVTLKPSGV